MPQSNSIVERANGVIKRIIKKLIYNHMNEDYSKWSHFIDEAKFTIIQKMFQQEKYQIIQHCFNRKKI